LERKELQVAAIALVTALILGFVSGFVMMLGTTLCTTLGTTLILTGLRRGTAVSGFGGSVRAAGRLPLAARPCPCIVGILR
jgi:hypothetical protein